MKPFIGRPRGSKNQPGHKAGGARRTGGPRPGAGAPKWQPTDQQRGMTEAMVAVGVPHSSIAQILGITQPTLLKHLRKEIETGAHMANGKIAQFLFNGIIGAPNSPPFASERDRMVGAFFWLKCRAGWKETVAHEIVRSVKDMTDEEIEARLAVDDPETPHDGRVVAFPHKPKLRS